MSKSKGNVVTPMGLLEEHGSDAVRYWAAKGGPGVDTAFDPGQMKVGRRLAIKLLNASKFVLSKSGPAGAVIEPIDRGMLQRLSALVSSATRHLEAYDYAAALRETEEFFWWFCDDYIELVKRRRSRDGEDAASATTASVTALSTLLRLLAPFLPFATEDVWSWWHEGSIHQATWPQADEISSVMRGASPSDLDALARASAVTAGLRQERSSRKLGFGVPVRATLTLPTDFGAHWRLIARDVLDGNNVLDAAVEFAGDALQVSIEPHAADA
jgi:valyl-tRNA synthetase